MKMATCLAVLLLITLQGSHLESSVQIAALHGDVRVRRGLEERWSPASVGMSLDDIDTILTGEGSHVLLQIEEGMTFTLGGLSVLDIGDLRRITERELFLFLMSEKINRIGPVNDDSRIRIDNVSVTRADNKNARENDHSAVIRNDFSTMEINGARALYDQKYYPNAIIKFHRLMAKNLPEEARITAFFYLGKSFEGISESGRAIEAYQSSLTQIGTLPVEDDHVRSIRNACEEALQRLKDR